MLGGTPGVGITLQPLQIRAQVSGVLIAKVAILLQRLVDDVFQFRRDVWVQTHGRHGWLRFRMALKINAEVSPRNG